ncbi:MAG: hypothetical protein V3S08_00280, partial [Phycisphaerales bacterium]
MGDVMGLAYTSVLEVLPGVGCIECGAVFDLQFDSLVITTLPAVEIPAHAMVGIGGSDIMSAGLLASLG